MNRLKVFNVLATVAASANYVEFYEIVLGAILVYFLWETIPGFQPPHLVQPTPWRNRSTKQR